MASSADVPGVYDVVINGQGYVLANTVDPSLPFRTQRARYTYTPTFLERQNVGAGYSDNAQDFFLTESQHDWSLGEGQRFFVVEDDKSRSRFWRATNADVSFAGQVTGRTGFLSSQGSTSIGDSVATISKSGGYLAGVSRLYTLPTTNGGTLTNLGAHGLGATPATVVADPVGNAYLSGTGGGTVGVRKYNAATTSFSTFSTSACDSLAFLNNTLFGYRTATADLIQYSTSGTVTSLYTWKGADGTAAANSTALLVPFGQQLVIANRAERAVWLYNGSGVSKLFDLPHNFYPEDGVATSGVLLLSGYFGGGTGSSGTLRREAVIYYTSGAVGTLWSAYNVSDAADATYSRSPVTTYDRGAIWVDPQNQALVYWDMALGGVSSVATTFTPSGGQQVAGTANGMAFFALVGATSSAVGNLAATKSGGNGNYCATAFTINTSLFDFGNTLTKTFRGVTVDATLQGSSTLEIGYQVDGLPDTGTANGYTQLTVNGTPGTEYAFPAGTQGRAVSIKVRITGATSPSYLTSVLKRIYVRASPQLQAYRRAEYILDLSGRDGETPVRLRNGQDSPLDGQAMATNLRTAATSTTPISITDRFGTFNGIIEPDQFELLEIGPEEYLARVGVREV